LFFLSTDFYNWHKAVPEDFLFTLAAHETAHQRFGMLVANDQALEPWLDESLCTYSEVLFLEPEYPQALDWWWQYRVNYYEPQGAVNISIYDPPQWAGQYRLYRDPVYLRGAQMIQELRQAMGDEAFFSGLRAYVGRYAYGMAGGEGFWEVMQNFGGEAVLGVRDKYFSGGELPAP
jgi:aminopeptidase N